MPESPEPAVRRRPVLRRVAIIVAAGLALGLALNLAQMVFQRPGEMIGYPDGPSVYINSYEHGRSFPDTILYYGARWSVAAAHASLYAETNTPAGIDEAIRTAAAAGGAPVERITIASHGIPGGLILDREREAEPLNQWLLKADGMVEWVADDLAAHVARDADVVLESCDTSPVVRGAAPAESRAFRAALAAALGIPRDHIVLFHGPAKYGWTLDGWRPRTVAYELSFKRDATEDTPA